MNKHIKRLSIAFLAVLVLTEALVALSYQRGTLAMQAYMGPLTLVFFGLTLSGYRRKLSDWMGVVFIAWFVISRMLLGETYLEHSTLFLMNLCSIYLLCYPFARVMQDGSRQQGLRVFAWLFTAVFSLFAWLCIGCCLTQRWITLPVLQTSVFLFDGRLSFNVHPNITAAMFLLALLLGVWLWLEAKWPQRAVLAVLCVGCFAGIALTASRTVMLQAAFGMGVLSGLAFLQTPKRTLRRWGLALLGGVLVMAGVYLLFGAAAQGVKALTVRQAAEAFNTDRSLADGLGNGMGRGEIYQAVFALLRDHPRTWLLGMCHSRLTGTLTRYSSMAAHAHNAYLQTLLTLGLPGVLMALWLSYRTLRAALRVGLCASVSLCDRFVCALPAVLLVSAISESYLFTEYLTVYGMTYTLLLGYAMELEHRLCAPFVLDELFSLKRARKQHDRSLDE